MAAIDFTLLKTDKKTGARRGILRTPHGDINTPVFMPVGTGAAVKGMWPDQVEALGAQIILSNTYHLFLRPGEDVILDAGGLHDFMNWRQPILTDSGGFQVFSLGRLRKIDEDGVSFRNHIDGAGCLMTPERSIQIQNDLGADIIMAFDECAPYPADREYIANSMRRTTRWLVRCKAAHRRQDDQALFAIMQGGMYKDLRRESALAIVDADLPGYAVGGLSVGEPKEIMLDVLDSCVDYLPKAKPRYLMGIGTPDYVLEAVERGIDMCDCVEPTRIARHGVAMTTHGRMNIKNLKYERDYQPLDPDCGCEVCLNYTRSYIRHVFKAGEMMSAMLLSYHNLYFLSHMMSDARKAIEEDRYAEFKKHFLEKYYG